MKVKLTLSIPFIPPNSPPLIYHPIPHTNAPNTLSLMAKRKTTTQTTKAQAIITSTTPARVNHKQKPTAGPKSTYEGVG